MILYHYTCVQHLPKILQTERLKVTESNVSRTRMHAGPDVVWLTTEADPSAGHGLQHPDPRVDKTRIRFTVEVPDEEVITWAEFADAHQITKRWRAYLESFGGSETWRLVARPIPKSEWREVRDTKT